VSFCDAVVFVNVCECVCVRLCMCMCMCMWTIATFSSMAIFVADTRAASALCFSWATSVRRITRICLNCAAVTFVVGISILNLMCRERGRGGAGRQKMSGNFDEMSWECRTSVAVWVLPDMARTWQGRKPVLSKQHDVSPHGWLARFRFGAKSNRKSNSMHCSAEIMLRPGWKKYFLYSSFDSSSLTSAIAGCCGSGSGSVPISGIFCKTVL